MSPLVGMASGTSYTTLLQERRNRILAGFYKNNPREKIPELSNEIYLQVKAGRVPIHRITAGGESITIEPCGCAVSPPPPPPPTGTLLSKNNTTDGGFPVGNTVTKDMTDDSYTLEFDPNSFQTAFFPGMADFVDGNIVAGDKAEEDRLRASYWDDLGNDIFDDWGFFYLYDPASGKYYFPLINPQNQDDGILTTQTFNAFGRTFTIQHGWAVQGIFKFDISVADTLPFRFGAYGNMGSDESTAYAEYTYPYTINSTNLTLYYHYNEESGDSNERLYIYTLPKKVADNLSQTYSTYYDGDDMSYMTNEITTGAIIYFAKTNDIKEWVVNDLALA